MVDWKGNAICILCKGDFNYGDFKNLQSNNARAYELLGNARMEEIKKWKGWGIIQRETGTKTVDICAHCFQEVRDTWDALDDENERDAHEFLAYLAAKKIFLLDVFFDMDVRFDLRRLPCPSLYLGLVDGWVEKMYKKLR